MQCSNCRSEIDSSARFCSGCGRTIAAVPIPRAKKKTHPFTKLLAVVFGFMVLLIVIANIAARSGGGSPSATSPAKAPPTVATADTGSGTTDSTANVKLTAAQQATVEVAARKAYAKILDRQLLDLGIESQTYTVGSDAKTLVIKDALAGRVRVNALGKNDSLFSQMRALGFKHLKYENGFEDDMYFGVHWDF